MALRMVRFGVCRALQGRRFLLYRPSALHPARYASARSAQEVDDESDKPITYSTSKAAKWRAQHSFEGQADVLSTPWYQTYAVVGSISALLLYFCYFREENDMDDKLRKPLSDYVPQYEAAMLVRSIKYRQENGLDVSEHKKRLEELKTKIKSMEN